MALQVKIGLNAADRVSRPFENARRSTDRLRSAVSETTGQVRQLERVSGDLESFRRLRWDARSNAAALAQAQAKVDALSEEMAKSDRVTKAMRSEFAAAKKDVARLSKEAQGNTASMQALRAKLSAAGIDTKHLGAAQRRLKTELDATRRAADQQGQALDRARKKAEAMSKARARMDGAHQRAGSLAMAGAAGMAMGGTALAVGGMSAAAGINFEEQMSAVGALARLDKTSEAFQKLKAQAAELGATTSFSASEAAGGMRFLAMSGFEAAEIMAAMPGMLDLAKAGGTDLATTADIASNILSGFRLEADQMGRVGDVLAATFTRSNVDLAMLGDTMKYVAPIATELGTSVEEAAAMAGLLGNVGIQGSEAGTAMRALHTRMAGPPKAAAEALDMLGVATRNREGDLRSMIDILADVAKATEDMGNAERVAAFKDIAGEEAGAAMAQLVNEGGSGAISQFVDILRNAGGEATRIAQQMGDNASGDIKGFWSAIEGMNIALTETNASPLRDLVQTATSAVRATTEWVKANPELAGGLVKVAAAAAGLVFVGGALAATAAGILGPFAMLRFAMTAAGIQTGIAGRGAGLLSRAIGGIASVARVAFPVVVGGIRAMSMAMMANPLGLILGGIALAATLLITFWEPISGFFSDLWSRVSGYFAGAWQGIKTALGFSPMAILASAWQPISAFFTGLWSGVGGVFSAAWDGIKAALGFTPLGLLATHWEPITGYFGTMLDGLTGMFGKAWDWILAKMETLAGPLQWIADKVGGLFGGGGGGGGMPAPQMPEPRPVPTRPVAAATTALAVAAAPVAAMPPAPVHQEIQIVVNAAPGMDEKAVAQEVRRQLEQLQARERAAQRTRLYDGME